MLLDIVLDFSFFSRGYRRKKPADFWFFITADSPSNADLTFAPLLLCATNYFKGNDFLNPLYSGFFCFTRIGEEKGRAVADFKSIDFRQHQPSFLPVTI